MAIGDKAAVKGLTVFPSTQDKRLGYQNDNQRGDDIADEIDARAAADTALSNRLAVTDVKVSATQPSGVEGRLWFKIL